MQLLVTRPKLEQFISVFCYCEMSYYTCTLQITEGLYCINAAVSGLYYYPLITRHTSAVYYGSDHGQSSQCLSIPAVLWHVSEVSCFAKDSGLVYF